MSSRSAVGRLLALAALTSFSRCVDLPEREPAPMPEPAPVVAPDPPPPVPTPPVVEASAAGRAILAWRVGTAERSSILFAVPPYPASLATVFPEPWSAELDRIHRLVVLAGPEHAALLMARHGLGSARTDLREVIGDEPFARLLSRLESIDPRTERTALAGLDARGASLLLVVAELGYRAPGEGVLEQLLARTVTRGEPIVPLIDGPAFTRWAEAASETDVAGELRERIADSTRTSSWSEAQRAAYERADLAALAIACDEPARTASWNESTRRANRELSVSLVEPVVRELGGEPAIVALDGCLFAGDAGLVAALRARGMELVPLGPTARAAAPGVVPTTSTPAVAPLAPPTDPPPGPPGPAPAARVEGSGAAPAPAP